MGVFTLIMETFVKMLLVLQGSYMVNTELISFTWLEFFISMMVIGLAIHVVGKIIGIESGLMWDEERKERKVVRELRKSGWKGKR
jgi:hypothetical protein